MNEQDRGTGSGGVAGPERFRSAAASVQPGLPKGAGAEGQEAKGLGRRAREQAARRREILEVARRLFAQRGYGGTTLEDIARQAEFAKPTLYQFFPGKEDLFYTILLEGSEDLHQIVAKVRSQASSSSQQFRALGIMFLIYFRKNLDFFLIWRQFRERLRRDSELKLHAKAQKSYADLEARIVEILRQGMDLGELQPMDANRVAIIFLESLAVYTHAFQEGGEIRTANEMADELMKLFLNGLMVKA
jgi:AcrR family transcriptional regulator